MTIVIRTQADIRAIEVKGREAFTLAGSPYALLRRAAAKWPETCAVHYVPSDGAPEEKVSFGELFERVNRAIALFQRLGAGPKAAVAVIMPHTLNSQVALWAAERAGLACPINPMLQEDHITALLQRSGARMAVVLGVNAEVDVWDRVARAAKALGDDFILLDADSDAPSPGSFGSFEKLVSAEPLQSFEDPDPAAMASLYPTGGTTGAPKLTIHTHDNEAFIATAISRMHGYAHSEVMLNGFPLFHVAGAFVYGLSCIAAGATQLVPGRLGMRNKPFVSTMWRQVERYRISMLGAVPTVLSALVSQPVADADISSLRVALTGGSLLPTDLADGFEAMSGVPVRNIFGMTESSGVLTAEPAYGPRTPGSTGLPLPFTEIKVVRPGTDELREPGTSGLVMARGPHVSPGYLDAGLGRDTFLADGWLATGDLGYLDANGCVYLTGRAKDVIIRGGHNIDPSGIEDALIRHPAVAVAAAVGLPDRYAGELPAAFVTLHPGAEATEAELVSFAMSGVPEPAACPKRVWIIETMPLTPVGKIFKPTLRLEAARRAVAAIVESMPSPPTGINVNLEDSTRIIVSADLPNAQMANLREALAGMPLEVRATAS